MRVLRAGPVTALLDGIDLRYLRIGSTEILRRIYAAVRDLDWDTPPAAVSNLRIEEGDSAFRVEFDARHTWRGGNFSWHGTITGDENGRIEYLFDGWAEDACSYQRIGICVHHPWRETAGARFVARTPDGDIDGTFPDLIGPQVLDGTVYAPLFPAFDRLEVELAGGGTLLLEFEGDLWEVEDHRNWTDANFKTYSTPLGLGRPDPLVPGQPLRQRLVMTQAGVTDGDLGAGPVRLTIGPPTGTRVPAIGLGQDRDHQRLDANEHAVLSAMAPAHLRAEVRLDRAGWREALALAQETAAAVGCHLEVSLHLLPAHADELDALAAQLARGPSVDRVLVINADSAAGTPAETTRPALVDLVREALASALGSASFVGGTEIYFGEINRTRPRHGAWDGVCYSITPQIHAFTDVDVMENLDAQAETVRSARALVDGKAVIVSPITLRRRFNFYAHDEPPPDEPGQLPDAVDVRQSSLFGAAWTAGSLKYVAEAGAAAVTYYETTGWRGVVERATGPELPERFFSGPGQVFPIYHPLADAMEWRDAQVLHCQSSDPLGAVGFAVRTSDGTTRLLLANLTPRPVAVEVAPLEGSIALRRLNEHTAARAGADPAGFRASWERPDAPGPLALAPYEVVRVDVEST
jgi:hypothetical protein